MKKKGFHLFLLIFAAAGMKAQTVSLPWGMNCWMPQTGKMGDPFNGNQ